LGREDILPMIVLDKYEIGILISKIIFVYLSAALKLNLEKHENQYYGKKIY
jgi:hypothetical protein